MGMNWDDMRIFLAIAHTGSVSGAARQLDVQHSTVSRRLQQLEKSLGVRLADKKRNGYELTPAGESLKESALRMEREMLVIDGNMLDQDKHLAGKLRVATANHMASTFLLPVFSRFTRRYPEIDLQLTVSTADVSLAQREADVAIRVTNTPIDTLIGKKIGTVASAVYGNHNYVKTLLLQHQTPAWVAMNCCDFHRHWYKKLSGGERYRLCVDDPLVAQQMIKQGEGLAILPCYLGDSDTDLQRYSQPQKEMNQDLWCLFHTDLKRTERIRVFRDFLSTELASMDAQLAGDSSA